MHCDLVVLETGLGGALDATNIVSNVKAAVFTSISRDHMGVLGNTLEEIAANKAGIIKPDCMVISSAQEPEVHEVIKKCAEEKGCSLIFTEPEKIQIEKKLIVDRRFHTKERKHCRSVLPDGISFSMRSQHGRRRVLLESRKM